jgi:cytochrome c
LLSLTRGIKESYGYRTGLSQGAVQKIQELKGLMNKYPQYHANPDGIIRLAIYNSINGDGTLLDSKLEQPQP